MPVDPLYGYQRALHRLLEASDFAQTALSCFGYAKTKTELVEKVEAFVQKLRPLWPLLCQTTASDYEKLSKRLQAFKAEKASFLVAAERMPAVFKLHQVKLPPYFSVLVNEEYFKKALEQKWETPNSDLDQTSLNRFERVKQAVLKQAYADYKITFEMLQRGQVILRKEFETDEALIEQVSDCKDEEGCLEYIYNPHYPLFSQALFIRPFAWTIMQVNHFLNQTSPLRPKLDALMANKAAFSTALNYPLWTNRVRVHMYGTPLSCAISNTDLQALDLIDAGADVNKYAASYGNNPILISVAKGWNHVDSDGQSNQQKPIIEKLLASAKLDINACELNRGFTALHLACLRGDDPAFIHMLLEKGADSSLQDYEGFTALDLTEWTYEDVQQIIAIQTGNEGAKWNGNKSYTATLPLPQERASNIEKIKLVLVAK
jgi:hypothetical protein